MDKEKFWCKIFLQYGTMISMLIGLYVVLSYGGRDDYANDKFGGGEKNRVFSGKYYER
jgi:hypothetical protein